MQTRFHRDAELEATAAVEWYETRQRGLGSAFLEELDHSLEFILESPNRWPLHPGLRASLGVRRRLLSRFPYAVAYQIDEQGIAVIAVAHLARRPGYWRSRLKS